MTSEQNAARLLRDHMAHRVDITPIIDELNRGRFVLPRIYQDTLEKTFPEISIPELIDTWIGTKPIRNACLSLCISYVWNSFAQTREDMITERRYTGLSITQLREVTKLAFIDATHSWETMTAAASVNHTRFSRPIEKTYTLLDTIIKFGNRHFTTSAESVAELIEDGIGTSSLIIWTLIHSISDLAEKQGVHLSVDDILAITERSYGSVVLALSGMNQDMLVPIVEAMVDQESLLFKPGYFSLTNLDTTPTLQFHHDALLSVLDEKGEPVLLAQPAGPTTWCPARFSKGNHADVIRENFEYILSMARAHWGV